MNKLIQHTPKDLHLLLPPLWVWQLSMITLQLLSCTVFFLDFLPIFVWVLVHCGFTRAEIEAEYMWGLAHPSLFNGEGGYYLTTLTSAINVLKEITSTPQPASPMVCIMSNTAVGQC